MEALPRMPMVSFELLSTSEKVSFAQKLKLYIASFYQEDPESYNNEIRALEGLRAQAVWPSIDINSCQIMKKYYCQLHFLKSRFPMEENQISAVCFAWKDDYTKMSCNAPDINFELMCMLINIGCIHSKLGAEDTRTSPEGMKMSCTHFQCAAWAFQTVRETFGQLIGLIMISSEQIRAMQLMCLAQAQECILEKSLLDNRKPTIIAKIAVQLCEYYKHAGVAFQSGDDCLVLEHFPNHKYLAQYLQFKIDYHRCIALLYQGQQAEEQQKMGERVAFYQAAVDMLDEAVKHASKMSSSHQALFKDTIAFTLDVIKGKHKAAVNENEFIYHEDVPQLASLQEIKGASLVKGIPFNVHDSEVAGPDIFGRLVPMEAHEASSMYSEKKAQLLRNVGEKIEQKDMELCDFLNSMQLEVLSFVKSSKGLPQELVDRAASMVARPNAIKELVEAMGKLSNSYQEVEAMLQDIQDMLKVEEESEKEYQKIMGKRPPSIIATDLARECAKYQEAHGKASESNLNLHKAMTTHAANIKLLAQPLNQLVQIVPTLNLPDSNVDEKILESIENLMDKVDEMKNQRMMLWNQLREAIHNDDITGAIVTKEADQTLDAVFQQALDKHVKITAVIDQNLLAQENICKALVEMYAKFTPTRKYLQDLFHKRNSTLSALISSHDTYDDLIMKANKGIDFYSKLESNVSKLLGRIKSACNVQQEERDQMLIKNGHSKQHAKEEPIPQAPAPEMNNMANLGVQTNTNNLNMQYNSLNNVNVQQPVKPKLKDYLDSRKEIKEQRKNDVLGPQMQYPSSSMYSTGVNMPGQNLDQSWNNGYHTDYVPPSTGYSHQYNNSVTTSQYNGGGYTQVNYSDKSINKELTNKLNALKINLPSDVGSNPSSHYDNVNSQAYGAYNNYAAPSTSAYTAVVGATTVPAMATSQSSQAAQQGVNYTQQPEQYTPDASNGPNYAAYSNYSTNTAPGLSTDITSSLTNYKQYADQPNNYYQQPGQFAGNYYNYTETRAQQPQSQPVAAPDSVNQYSTQYQYYNADSSNQGFAQNAYSGYPSSNYSANYNTSTTGSNNTGAGSSVNYAQYPYAVETSANASQPFASTTEVYPYGSESVQPPAVNTATPPPASYNQNLSNSPYTANPASVPPPLTQQTPQATPTPTPPPSNAVNASATSFGNYYPYTSSTLSSLQPDIASYNTNQSLPSNQQYNNASYQYPNNVGVATVTTTPPSAGVNYMYQTPASGTDYGYNAQGYNYSNQYSNGVYDYSANPAATSSVGAYQTPTATANTYQYPTPPAGSTSTTPYTENTAQLNSATPKKESSIDLLAGLDFSINQAPLIPQVPQQKKEIEIPKPDLIETPPKKTDSEGSNKLPPLVKKKDKVLLKGDPFRNPNIIEPFLKEVERFEKYVVDLSLKTVNGPSNLEQRWKEILDSQDNMEPSKKSISVARCYPLKNRSPDILPFDHSRVALVNTMDDYINASHVSVGPYCMDFVLTQLPLAHTVQEFWNMVWEQQIETIVCLLADNEINEGCYWPSEPGKDLNVTRRVILAHSSTNEHWTERKLTISDEKESRLINIFQYTAWPGSLFPANAAPYIDFLQMVVKSYEKQKCTGNPVLVHCLAGVGRTGICATLLAGLMEFAAVACPLPDIPVIAAKISCARKNALRDREHLRFVYSTMLQHLQSVRKGYIKCDNEKADETVKKAAVVVDPFTELDPLWATRKS